MALTDARQQMRDTVRSSTTLQLTDMHALGRRQLRTAARHTSARREYALVLLAIESELHSRNVTPPARSEA